VNTPAYAAAAAAPPGPVGESRAGLVAGDEQPVGDQGGDGLQYPGGVGAGRLHMVDHPAVPSSYLDIKITSGPDRTGTRLTPLD
jgi:hypothetical protein